MFHKGSRKSKFLLKFYEHKLFHHKEQVSYESKDDFIILQLMYLYIFGLAIPATPYPVRSRLHQLKCQQPESRKCLAFLRMSINHPSFLYEVFESESEDEEIENRDLKEKVKSATICNHQFCYHQFPQTQVAELDILQICFLCGNLKKWASKLSEELDASEYTFSDVLNKVFSREQLTPYLARKDHSHGVLCSYCKDLVSDMFSRV